MYKIKDSSGSTCEYKWFLVWNQNNSDLDYLTLVKDGVLSFKLMSNKKQKQKQFCAHFTVTIQSYNCY